MKSTIKDFMAPQIVELFVKNLKVIYEAQTMEFLWRDSFQCPTEEEYRQMAFKSMRWNQYLQLNELNDRF